MYVVTENGTEIYRGPNLSTALCLVAERKNERAMYFVAQS